MCRINKYFYSFISENKNVKPKLFSSYITVVLVYAEKTGTACYINEVEIFETPIAGSASRSVGYYDSYESVFVPKTEMSYRVRKSKLFGNEGNCGLLYNYIAH
jgi:hypothetical protein